MIEIINNNAVSIILVTLVLLGLAALTLAVEMLILTIRRK
jgi:hypothetical protein